jgi:hypothetical protein
LQDRDLMPARSVLKRDLYIRAKSDSGTAEYQQRLKW